MQVHVQVERAAEALNHDHTASTERPGLRRSRLRIGAPDENAVQRAPASIERDRVTAPFGAHATASTAAASAGYGKTIIEVVPAKAPSMIMCR